MNTMPPRAKGSAKLSLRTHCPLMVRAVVEGESYFEEEICRCDIPDIKRQLHPTRCPSNNGCPVRQNPLFIEEGAIVLRYELL